MGWTPVSPWKIIPTTTQKMTATGTSAASGTIVGTQTRAIMLTCMTANVHFEVGPSPVATATGSFLLKTTDDPLIVGCQPGDKVAVIQDTSGGVLYFCELTH